MTDTIQKYYNSPDENGFLEDFKQLHALSLKCGVGFSLVFEEASNEWYITIDSSAPSESTVTKSRSLWSVLDVAIQHLKRLQ